MRDQFYEKINFNPLNNTDNPLNKLSTRNYTEYPIEENTPTKYEWKPSPVYQPVARPLVVIEDEEPIKRGITVYKNKGMNVGEMQPLLDKFNEYGINVRVTSGVRNTIAKSTGQPSLHNYGRAIDITPIDGETFQSLYDQIFNNPKLLQWLRDNKYSWLDETTPEAMANNGSSGKHYHWDKDSTFFSSRWNEFDKKHGIPSSRWGGILRMQGGGITYTPFKENKPKVANIQNTLHTILNSLGFKGYTPNYKFDNGRLVKSSIDQTPKSELNVEAGNAPKKDWHERLYDFTKAYETFSPDVYKLNGQQLIGYGSANKNLVEKQRITEQEAYEQMVRDYADIEETLSNKIKNWDLLDDGTKIAMMDTAYNGGVNGFLKKSPKLMRLLNAGITDGKILAKELDHSQSKGGWLAVRSKARQAMAAGDYDWDWEYTDKYGRQKNKESTSHNDWEDSPYYNYTYNYEIFGHRS